MNEMAPTKASSEFEKDVIALMPKIKTFALSRTGNAAEAEDLVQETVLKALSKHHQFQPGTSLSAWLFTICKNEHFTRFRRKREVEDPDDFHAKNMSDESDDGESRSELDEIMNLLETLDPQTKAILLAVADGASYDEVAAKHGIAVGTVKSRINRARQVLLAARNDAVTDYADIAKAPEGLQEISKPVFVQPIVPPADFGAPPILRWLPISALRIDPRYQREILDRGKANVASIARAFDWNKFGTVIVASLNGGLFAIIDGQHRTTAANLCGITQVPCQVIDATTAQQAEAFAAINGNVTALTPMQIHHANVAAGDSETVRLKEVCDIAGVTVLRYPVPADKIAPGATMAVGSLRKALKRFGPAVLAVALSCITKTRGGNPGMIRQQIIQALCMSLNARPHLVNDPAKAIEKARAIKFAQVWHDGSVIAKQQRKSLAPVLTEMFDKAFGENS